MKSNESSTPLGSRNSTPRLPFPWTDYFFGYPTAVEITWLRAHVLAIDETVDATGVERIVRRHLQPSTNQ